MSRRSVSRIGTIRKMEVLGVYTPDEILPYDTAKDFLGYRVSRSLRYATFHKNRQCVVCGIRGEIMLLERLPNSDERPHFNLYAKRPDGSLLLMTKDHIVPSSRGGIDRIENMQTMCSVCNALKAGDPLSVEQVRQLKFWFEWLIENGIGETIRVLRRAAKILTTPS